MLRLGGADVKLTFLELLDNNIGPRGASALGMALTYGNNLSLLTLKLDYNTTLGDEGLGNLCKGIRTNVTLRQLHVQFCNITSQSGSALAELLANTGSGLTVLNVTGNRLGGLGLSELCKGLRTNSKLETIFLADNLIDQVRCLRDLMQSYLLVIGCLILLPSSSLCLCVSPKKTPQVSRLYGTVC